jgi:hypothetical protein
MALRPQMRLYSSFILIRSPQTIVSFANKGRLGGQSLANLQSHPFAKFQKELVAFADLMEKLQLKIEDSKLVELYKKITAYSFIVDFQVKINNAY